MPALQGKIAVITGGSSGIGLAKPGALSKREPTFSLRAAGRRSWIRLLPKSAAM